MMVGSNLNDVQLQQIVDKTILEADLDKDGKISFEEFVKVKHSSLCRFLLSWCCAAQMISNTDEIDQKLTFSLDTPAQS